MTRRRALLLALLAAGFGLASPPAEGEPPKARPRVVLVILGGGVRAREMLDPELMPTLADVASKGFALREVLSDAPTPRAGALEILTGRVPGPESDGEARPAAPTILEYARRGLVLPAEKTWFVCGPTEDGERLAGSEHPDWGPSAAPAVASGEGAFAEPLRHLLQGLGRPVPTPDATWPLLRSLRARSRAEVQGWLPEEVDAALPEAERVERAVLAEVDRDALLVRGPAPDDERAIRSALTVISVHRPVLTVLRLTGAEQAPVSVERYREVLRAADRGIARLRAALAADPAAQGLASLWVVADLGRNASPNAKGGLDADDASADRRFVALVAEGAGVRKGARTKGERRLADLCPTLGRLLDVPTPLAEGRVLEDLLAR